MVTTTMTVGKRSRRGTDGRPDVNLLIVGYERGTPPTGGPCPHLIPLSVLLTIDCYHVTTAQIGSGHPAGFRPPDGHL